MGSSPPESFSSLESVFMLSKNTTQYHKYIITYNKNMVVEDEEEEEEKQVTEIPEVVENLIGRDPIPSPLLPNSPHIQSEFESEPQSESPSHESSTVGVNIINNRDQSSLMAVFPPINHEGLYISSFHTHHENYPEFDRSLPAGDFEQVNLPLPLPIHRPRAAAWFNFLRCKLTFISSAIRNYTASCRGGFLLSFRSPAATVAAAMLLVLWYWSFQRHRRRLLIRRESRDQLIRIIREKDEKIDQLLRQIAQMNEILLAVHNFKAAPST